MKYVFLLLIAIFGTFLFQIIYCLISVICMAPIFFLISKFCNSKFSFFCRILLLLAAIMSACLTSFFIYFIYFYMYKYFSGDSIILNILTLLCCYILSISGLMYLTKNDPTPINQATTGWLMIALIFLSVAFYFTQSIYLVLIPFAFQIPVIFLSYITAKATIHAQNEINYVNKI